MAKLTPKKRRSIVLYGLTELEDGALALQENLVRRGFKPVRLISEAGVHPLPGVDYRRKLSLGGLWSFLRAEFVFTSHALYGGLPTGARQKTVLFWHGEVVKPVALLDGDRAVPADVAPVCSELARAFRCAEFGLHPSRVPVIGAPRNDRLLKADAAVVRARLGWETDTSVWLWLPTYRTAVRGERRHDGSTSATGLPFDKTALHQLDEHLVEHDLWLVIKPHPLGEQLIDGRYERLKVMKQSELDGCGVSLYELLASVSGLVTDVSSVWIDYLLTERPMVFAFPDLEEYRTLRGFNLEPYREWVPGAVVEDVTSLARELSELSQGADAYQRQRREMLYRFHRFLDAGSSDRLLDHVNLQRRSL